ncbi:heme-binding domain protein [Bacteriovorax sp. BSW11_IV]|uniref:heme-binding domain-containing protein n=1 Tax=Bacteriovorax sp. BSW11_IV TaxID=1353529 RepID=UPI00038A2BD4|nr:heme-binding domain-containing protein [Bacteriovorax sp. BSW11_IV]EQC43056.1 heme-binding domain protein [Bacteriovorax sp. BSW11_IV]
MKKALIILMAIYSGNIFSHGSEKHDELETKKQKEKNDNSLIINLGEEYKGQIKPIFARSCFDCHSQKTNYPWYYNLPYIKDMIDKDISDALSHIDFTNDFPFVGHGTPQSDLTYIKKSINEFRMPPKSYQYLHPSAKLSEKEIEIINSWIESAMKRLKD